MTITNDISINSALAIKEAAQQQKLNLAIAQTVQASERKSDAAVLTLLGQAVEVAQYISDQKVDAVA